MSVKHVVIYSPDGRSIVADVDVGATTLELPGETVGCLAIRGEEVWYVLPPGDTGQVLAIGEDGVPVYVTPAAASLASPVQITGSSYGNLFGPAGQGMAYKSSDWMSILTGWAESGTRPLSGNLYVQLPNVDGSSSVQFQDRTYTTRASVNDKGEIGCHSLKVYLDSGMVFSVFNASNQLIFDVDSSGNVRCAGTLTQSLGPGL